MVGHAFQATCCHMRSPRVPIVWYWIGSRSVCGHVLAILVQAVVRCRFSSSNNRMAWAHGMRGVGLPSWLVVWFVIQLYLQLAALAI